MNNVATGRQILANKLPKLMQLLMEAAQDEVGCEAGCVWQRDLDGTWMVLDQRGEHPDLAQVQPADVQALRQEENVVLFPVVSNNDRYGVIALAGTVSAAPGRLGRLRHLTRAMDLAIGRVTV